MADRSLKKECGATAKKLRKLKDPVISGELYFILPRLREAKKAFARGGSAELVSSLSSYLKLNGYRAGYESLRSFFAGSLYGDGDVRRIRFYLILVYSRLILSGECQTARLREAEKLDFAALTDECSPLERRLLRYGDYDASDGATRAEYRRLLRRLAAKKKTDPAAALKDLPDHRFTSVLFAEKDGPAPYILMLISVFILFFCLIALTIGNAAAALLAAAPVFCLSQFVCSEICGRLIPPHVCARLKEGEPLPRCLIVITAVLENDMTKIAGRLENMYLSETKYVDAGFGILADLPDSEKKYDDGDDRLIGRAEELINALNEKYGGGFYLFYRQRRYSLSERRFIAPERKRGAVCELVKQLHTGSSALEIRGDAAMIRGIPYLITLDGDTVLYPGSAASLLRCAEHPANKAVTDPAKRTVVRGHGILQPRIGTVLGENGEPPFCSVFARDRGTEPYRFADFDVMSAVFGRGSFCGKGLINVEAFFTCCCGVFRDGIILSHDTLEGCRCRCGAVTDTVLYEGVPKNALSYFKRLERWVRGDVQSLPFTGAYLNTGKEKIKNGIGAYDRFVLYNSVISASAPVFSVACIVCGALTGTLPALSAAGLCYLWAPSLLQILSRIYDRERAGSEISYFIMRVSFLFYEASTVLSAILRAVFRLITKKNTLQWTTASAADSLRRTPYAYALAFAPSVIFGAALTVFTRGAAVFSGVTAMLSPIIAYRSSLSRGFLRRRAADKAFLTSAAADHMRYFSDLVNAEHSYLPPDNYQEFCGRGAAARTSPTNIGLYLLSVVAAADLGIYPRDSLGDRLLPTLRTLMKLPKKDGLLYNWYDTHTLAPLGGFVSTVDCGNYLACLVTLKQALEEYRNDDPGAALLSEYTDRLIGECDLSPLYDEKAGLFRIGAGDGSGNHYDMYCSEMLTTDVLAAAFDFAPPRHVGALARPVIRGSGRRGIASFSGTAFEYFMPALFLPAPSGSAADLARSYAAYRQEKLGVPFCGRRVFGASESCYFAFDADMNYQYKAHGVKELALYCDGRERVISPYSLFLMLGRSAKAAECLSFLKENGLYGKYGFYEALDLTKSRVGNGFAVIKCHMAHHIGMSVTAAANAVLGGVFIKRFCSDPRVAAVLPLMYEKAPSARGKKYPSAFPEPVGTIPAAAPAEPDCALLTNTVCTAAADPFGTGLYFKGMCVCDEKADGMRGLSLFCGGGTNVLSHPARFSESRVIYGADECGARLTVCPDLPVFRIDAVCTGRCALAFEPVLRRLSEHGSHTAYSSLFITAKKENGAVFFTRRGRSAFTVCTACVENGRFLPLDVRINGEETYGKTAAELLSSVGRTEDFQSTACVFPRLFAAAEAESNPTFLISAANTEEEAYRAVKEASARKEDAGLRLPPCDLTALCRILRCIMRPAPRAAAGSSAHGAEAILYRHGISGDRPVVLLDATGPDGVSGVRAIFPGIASAAVRLLTAGVGADTVILYDGDDGYFGSVHAELCRMIGSCGLSALLGRCVFTVPSGEDEKKLLEDTAAIRFSAEDRGGSPPDSPKKNVFVKKIPDFRAAPSQRGTSAVIPVGCGFAPMNFIYANACFGALVTDRSGGFCWYGNSRMFALTDHDTSPGGPGDELVLEHGGKYYELFSYADECRFFPHAAKWSGCVDGVPYQVTLCVDGRAPYKVVKVTTELEGTLSLNVFPVLGERRRDGTLRYARFRDTAVVSRAYGAGTPSLFVRCADSVSDFDGRKLSVRKEHSRQSVFIVGAAYSRALIEYADSSYRGAAARYLAKLQTYLSPFTLHGADPGIDLMFNFYARYQALYCRMYARCGPYQTGGAFGFRDQLQDVLCTMYGDPAGARAHLLRCAARQYEEGDVMHWFHPLTDRGVRTRCSDDMLWLPYAVSEYVAVTGDRSVLDKKIRYIKSPPLDGERDRYEKAAPSEIRGTLLEHCLKAVSRISTGGHGLCLMGGGDWNDGMDEAGAKGMGESVWLTLFAADVLRRTAELSGDGRYAARARELIKAVEEHGWDGSHYIRGYLDGGEPFGKSGDPACDTDILPQAFAAMLGLDEARTASALDDMYNRLYDQKRGIFRLFAPPYDGQHGIGYISSYPPGIRENGAQYTHAAVWGAMGFFAAGMRHRGFEILKALCPQRHGRSAGSFASYGREPYVLCGDVYYADGLEGHGGWSWYTGSAGWFFRAVLGSLLGYREHDGGFEIAPAFCADFRRFTLTVNRRGTEYTVNAEDADRMTLLDGSPCDRTFFLFDGGKHTLDIGRK